MNISLHLVLASLLVATAIVVIVCEPALRRRVSSYRALQILSLVGAVVLAPVQVVLATTDHGSSLTHLFAVVLSVAVLIAIVGVCVVGWSPATRTALPRRILAIGAHPDDLELACAGTLAKLVDSGHEVHGLVMSEGAIGATHQVRAGEAKRAGALLGLTSVTVSDFPDTYLSEHTRDMVGVIESHLRRLNPDLVLTHSKNDQHQDHEAVHVATLRAARQHHSILCFESPSVTPAFSPQVFIDVRDYVPAKAGAIAVHRDQSGKPYMTEDRTEALAGFRGAQSRLGSAEGFEAVRLQGFQGLI